MSKTCGSLVSILLLSVVSLCFSGTAGAASKDGSDSIVITFKDGHQQTFALTDIARIEFKTQAAPVAKSTDNVPDIAGRHHFVGKWTVGDGQGHTFIFTLEDSGEARNNVDEGGHGTWSYINGEARVSWDNGWHDEIRKVGSKYRKFAHEPGKSFDDPPNNTGTAEKTNAEPI